MKESPAKRAKIINVVSGKGGTGKSLLSAVLGCALAREGIRVLLIDFDIFVRGLTILLTESGKRRIRSEGATVAELLSGNQKVLDGIEGLAIERFYECDVLPSVKNIGEPFDFEVETPLNKTLAVIKDIFSTARSNYDLVLVDNRGGLDRLFIESCKHSDVVLAVAEDDDVALQTNANLINYLRFNEGLRNVYTVINKGRRIHSYSDLTSTKFRKVEFNYVGVIPFDDEIMEDFGTERFWSTIYQTLYFRAAIDAWNALARTEDLQPLSLDRYHFPPKIFMSPGAGRYSLIERMMILYGMTFALSGIVYWLYYAWKKGTVQLPEITAIISVVLGLVTILLSVFGFRRLLVGPRFGKQDKYDN